VPLTVPRGSQRSRAYSVATDCALQLLTHLYLESLNAEHGAATALRTKDGYALSGLPSVEAL
jgi:hypothetical protein